MLRSVRKAAGTAARIYFLSDLSELVERDWAWVKTLLAVVRHRYEDKSDGEADRTTTPITSDMAMLCQLGKC